MTDNPFQQRVGRRLREDEPETPPPPADTTAEPPKAEEDPNGAKPRKRRAEPKGPRLSALEQEAIRELETAGLPFESTLNFVPKGDSQTKARDIAHSIMMHHAVMYDSFKQLFLYTGTHWRRTPDAAIESLALLYDSEKMKASRQNEAMAFVKRMTYLQDIPWRRLGPNEIGCKNGVVDVESSVVRPHKREDYLETVIPHPYDHQTHAPAWLKCLDQWFGDDTEAEQKVEALQEFMGYCLIADSRYKKMLLVYGESDTGKSVIPKVLRILVGPENTCSLDVEELADARSRADIVGKLVNLLTEISVGAIVKDGPFKAIIDNEAISIDQKYQPKFSYQPIAKHVFCANNLPHITDQSRGVYNRLLLIKFNRVIPGVEQDRRLLDKLAGEIEGILAWAVEGVARLVRNDGTFTDIAESTLAVEEYRRDMNPVVEFITEKMDADDPDSGFVSETGLEQFREEVTKYYPKKNYSQTVLGRMLASAGYKVERVWSSEQGRRIRVLKGYRMAGKLL